MPARQFAKADMESINLNGNILKVVGQVQESVLNIHTRKVNQGDPGPDDHPVNSSWISSDWTGGGQIKWGRPDIVTGRFDIAIGVDTQQAKTITLSPLPTEYTDPGASGNDAMGLGQYNDKNYFSWGTSLYYYNLGTDAMVNTGIALTASPVAKGVSWIPNTGASAGTKLFVLPLGSSIDVYNGVSKTNYAQSAIDVAVWDRRLWRLGQNNELSYTYDLATWSTPVYITDASTPRHLNVYLTTGGDPTIYVTTDSSVYVWDDVGLSLIESELQYPKHPDQGRGSVVWRGELYTSVGDGAHRYNRSTIAPMPGLDRDDGLPTQYRGIIIDMDASYNAIYALMSGADLYPITATTDPDILHAGDDYMTYDTLTANTLLMRWNGFGWHYVDSNTGTAPTTVFVSDAGNDYAVWYCTNKRVRKIKLNRAYLNLKEDNVVPVVTDGFFESSWYNFGWDGQNKILKSIELFIETPGPTEYVEVFYKIDDDTNPFIKLGEVYDTGETAFYFGLQEGADPGSADVQDYIGVKCDRVKIRFQLHRTNTTNLTAKPIIRWFSVICRKMLRPIRSFQMVTDLTMNKGYTPDQQRQALLDIIHTAGAVDFTWQNETLKVELVALEFKSKVNPTDIVYVAKLNLIESLEEFA